MKVTKKTESIFEIEFDAYETEKLKDLESVFEIETADFIRRSFEQNLNSCTTSFDDLVDRLQGRLNRKDGD